jgi:hypothetical protein
MWNNRIVSCGIYKKMIDACITGSLEGTKGKIDSIEQDLFRGKDRIVTSPNYALEKLLSLTSKGVDLTEQGPVESIVHIMNNSNMGSISRNIKSRYPDASIPSGKLGILHFIFTYHMNREEPSHDIKKYYHPGLCINVSSNNPYKYTSKLLRLSSNSYEEIYQYALSMYNFDLNVEEKIFPLLPNMKGSYHLNGGKCLYLNLDNGTLGGTPGLYVNESTRLCSSNGNLLDRVSQISTCTEKRKNIPKHIKTLLWDSYHPDKLKGPCYICKKEIDARHFEAGHVVPASKGGSDIIDNLRPLCKPCNASMSNMELYEYKSRYHGIGDIDDFVFLPKHEDKDEETTSLGVNDILHNFIVSTCVISNLCRVKTRTLKDLYKTWNHPEKPRIGDLEVYLEEKYDKVRDGNVYYSGIGLTPPSGMSRNDKDIFIGMMKKYKDNTNILRDLQRKDCNQDDIKQLITLCRKDSKDFPEHVLSELLAIGT